MALLMLAFSILIRGVDIPLVAKKKDHSYKFKMIWLSSVSFHVLSPQAPAAAASPVLAYSCSFGGFLGGGSRWMPPDEASGRRVWGPGACWQLRGFVLSSCLNFSPEGSADMKGNKCLSVPVRGLVDIDASWAGLG